MARRFVRSMKHVSNERWVVAVPASPLVISLVAIVATFIPMGVSEWAVQLLTFVFLLAPFVGAGVLVCLCWAWLQDKVSLKHPRVVAGVALSLLDILIPVGILLFLFYALKDAKLTF